LAHATKTVETKKSYVLQDRELISGQNPFSDQALLVLLLAFPAGLEYGRKLVIPEPRLHTHGIVRETKSSAAVFGK
jgi:hypothetical protein